MGYFSTTLIAPEQSLRHHLSVDGDSRSSRRDLPSRSVLVAGLLTVFCLLLLLRRTLTGIHGFEFDDALIFYRYVLNMRHGFGLAWNPGEGPVFGLTSLPWVPFVWAISLTPLSPVSAVVVLSSLTGLAALLLLTLVCGRLMHRSSPRDLFLLFPAIALPLVLQGRFTDNMTNGMETMLGMFMVCLFIGVANWSLNQFSLRGPLLLAVAGELLILTRPEALLVALLLPFCLVFAQRRPEKAKFFATYLGALGILLAGSLTAFHVYFGSVVPLPFYLKWLHAYKGYLLYLNPFAYTATFLSMGVVPVVLIGVLGQRKHLRVIAAYWFPLVAVLAYLLTVNQIMGLSARYYVPFLPLLYAPTAYVIGDWLFSGHFRLSLTGQRVIVITLAVLATGTQFTSALSIPFGQFASRNRMVYPKPEFTTAAGESLPWVNWWNSCHGIGELASVLPPGSLISVSEVGLIGVLAPQVRILDSMGLNNAEIAHHGFNPDYLFAQKPDLIWLLHWDYTQDYGRLSADPRLLEQYTVYSSVFEFGIAIRKDSPNRPALERQLHNIWNEYYAGYDPSRYVAQRITWNPIPTRRGSRFLVIAP